VYDRASCSHRRVARSIDRLTAALAWHGAARRGAVRCGAVRCGAVRCGVTRRGAARRDTGKDKTTGVSGGRLESRHAPWQLYSWSCRLRAHDKSRIPRVEPAAGRRDAVRFTILRVRMLRPVRIQIKTGCHCRVRARGINLNHVLPVTASLPSRYIDVGINVDREYRYVWFSSHTRKSKHRYYFRLRYVFMIF